VAASHVWQQQRGVTTGCSQQLLLLFFRYTMRLLRARIRDRDCGFLRCSPPSPHPEGACWTTSCCALVLSVETSLSRWPAACLLFFFFCAAGGPTSFLLQFVGRAATRQRRACERTRKETTTCSIDGNVVCAERPSRRPEHQKTICHSTALLPVACQPVRFRKYRTCAPLPQIAQQQQKEQQGKGED
jgi:hypothetical protein